jgi:hypothetical protein
MPISFVAFERFVCRFCGGQSAEPRPSDSPRGPSQSWASSGALSFGLCSGHSGKRDSVGVGAGSTAENADDIAHLEDPAQYFAFCSPCQSLFRFLFADPLSSSRATQTPLLPNSSGLSFPRLIPRSMYELANSIPSRFLPCRNAALLSSPFSAHTIRSPGRQASNAADQGVAIQGSRRSSCFPIAPLSHTSHCPRLGTLLEPPARHERPGAP